MGSRRVNVKAILADADLRRKLMVSTIQATQAREGIDTTPEQAARAYYVATEAERTTFFDLERFKGGKRTESEQREEMFIRALRDEVVKVRFSVVRRDFSAIEGVPLAYRRVGLIAHVFRDALSLEPTLARAAVGIQTSNDARFVRQHWEVCANNIAITRQETQQKTWVRFAKGGSYARFYSDLDLVVHWYRDGEVVKAWAGTLYDNSHWSRILKNTDLCFVPGLTWPRRTQRGLNIRIMPEGCVFGDKGPAIFPVDPHDTFFILAVGNSALAEFILQGLMSFGSWEVGVLKRLPVPKATVKQKHRLTDFAKAIFEAKLAWDKGNEVSTSFQFPWLVGNASNDSQTTVATLLDAVDGTEKTAEEHVQHLYRQLNDEVYLLYGIPDTTRTTIEETLGERPPEILWAQMEGKSVDQKRMEHVWRVLSYAVKLVMEADEDGIVSFNAVNGEPRLVDRVRQELATLFPGRDANQVEVEIVNELKKVVKGYRKCASLDEWLDNVFFEYHAGLYKNRPIFWHIASAQSTSRFAFGALVHYHRFDKNRMAKLRASHVRDAIEEFRRETGLADKAGRSDDRLELQAKVEEAQALDRKLQFIQEGHHEGPEGGERDYRILTPWKEPGKRPKGWDPDLDDGVKVNIEPFEKAGVLRVGKVT